MSIQAAWILAPFGVLPIASMVVTARLPTLSTVSWQERTGLPSTWTVRATHGGVLQPYLAPTRPRWSRNTHRSGVLGSTSSPITRSSPLTLMCMGSPPVFRTGANFDSGDFGVQGQTGQKRLIRSCKEQIPHGILH